MKKYEESVDGDGNKVHFVPGNNNGVKGYKVVQGESPYSTDYSHNEKRKRLKAERKRKNKHTKRGR